MNAATKLAVRARALDRCEYCRLPQSAQPYVMFHVDHIVSRKHLGTDNSSNLALACGRCNAFRRRKGHASQPPIGPALVLKSVVFAVSFSPLAGCCASASSSKSVIMKRMATPIQEPRDSVPCWTAQAVGMGSDILEGCDRAHDRVYATFLGCFLLKPS
jgi:HNH endonuclease